MRRPFQQCVYRCASAYSCWDIALSVRRPTLSLLEAEKLVNKGLISAYCKVVYKSRILCAIFQLFDAASFQMLLLFEGGFMQRAETTKFLKVAWNVAQHVWQKCNISNV